MIYDDSILCPECNSYHTKWNNALRCFVCESCSYYIKLENNFNKVAHKKLMQGKENVMIGDRVMAYDILRKKYRLAKVVKRYGIVAHKEGNLLIWPEQDMCDVDFIGGYIGNDCRSKSHFTYGLEKI
jgi:hypothetical protein